MSDRIGSRNRPRRSLIIIGELRARREKKCAFRVMVTSKSKNFPFITRSTGVAIAKIMH